jgi:hypothetical protein
VTELHMHDCGAAIDCFKFFRKPCNGGSWELIYEGPESVVCDFEYAYGSCVIYRGERWAEIDDGKCTGSLHSSSEPTMCGCE